MSDFDETLTETLEFTAAFTPEAFPNLVKHPMARVVAHTTRASRSRSALGTVNTHWRYGARRYALNPGSPQVSMNKRS